MDPSILEVDRLTAKTRDATILTDISFTIARGTITAVFGPSGAGKSTLLRALAGQQPFTRSIQPTGETAARRPSRIEAALGCESLPRSLTVQQAVGRRAAASGVPLSQRPGRIARALDALDLHATREITVRKLSDGQRSATAIAAALASDSRVILIDSLLDALPEPLLDRLWDHLRARVAAEPAAVLIATSRSEIAERADRVLVLDDGRLLADSTPVDLLARHAREFITIEAADPALVQGTLRGISDVEIEEIPGGVRFAAADGEEAVAEILRHPPQGLRTVYLQRATLWGALESLRHANHR